MSSSNLVIVESPAKAKTISGYLGKEFNVKSSVGHIRDLPTKGLGIDIKNDFEPTYEADKEKMAIIKELKNASKDATVWLATDEDREGEAIAWHICEILKLDAKKTNRIVFHEITKSAITNALGKPRYIDMNLVDAQQARRILDRLVGYELSPVLWKKIKIGLSAGRVQSVAVRLLVEREREIRQFKPSASFKVRGEFESEGQRFSADLNDTFSVQDKAVDFLESLSKAQLTVAVLQQKPGKRSPGAPFTTSTLQQEAARKLGLGIRQTMSLAQKLYENGHITYMRTDSTNLSADSVNAAAVYIKDKYGENYLERRIYKTKNQSAQEAHEAIRPTQIDRMEAGEDDRQRKLYRLIWQRFTASQMSSAEIEYSEIHIKIDGRTEQFIAKGQVVKFDGFLKVYPAGKSDNLLPQLKLGSEVKAEGVTATETLSRAPSRYSEAALVKKLEELGIGRPSTYAPTIGTIQNRGYVERGDIEGSPMTIRLLKLEGGKVIREEQEINYGADQRKLYPTELAEIVTDFLVKYFGEILDYGFTAKAEQELDQIAAGQLAWREMLKDFYKKFHPLIANVSEVSRKEASGGREIGKDPASGKIITARFGRYGPMLQLGETESEEKPLFAPLPPGSRIENVTLDQALEMFKLPRVVGKTVEGDEISAGIGRFGPYLKIGKKFVSLKEDDPLSISEDRARQVIKEDQKHKANKVIADFGEIKILNGPYGPYITNGKANARIPKDKDPISISQEEAAEILQKNPSRRRRKK